MLLCSYWGVRMIVCLDSFFLGDRGSSFHKPPKCSSPSIVFVDRGPAPNASNDLWWFRPSLHAIALVTQLWTHQLWMPHPLWSTVKKSAHATTKSAKPCPWQVQLINSTWRFFGKTQGKKHMLEDDRFCGKDLAIFLSSITGWQPGNGTSCKETMVVPTKSRSLGRWARLRWCHVWPCDVVESCSSPWFGEETPGAVGAVEIFLQFSQVRFWS